ncbi:hypothetical protein CHARACLAT_010407 [Characodon lateralis]|uniref:Uncharacterized protein n=1 Tax=Characodon lateralis TaxID=208331 RepID=A0ABU7CYF1_9TELE|nr:hypothetical protein [Characodon lateralis]
MPARSKSRLVPGAVVQQRGNNPGEGGGYVRKEETTHHRLLSGGKIIGCKIKEKEDYIASFSDFKREF